jgi:predicted NBD/HSP70 family sugar kinase
MSSLGGRHLAALSELARLVADGTATRRGQLAQATGLSRAAVAQRVDLLISHGLLAETEPVPTERGRPPLALQLTEDTLVCAVDLGATHCRLALTTLGGVALAEEVREIDIDDGPRRTLAGVHELTGELLARADRPPQHLRAISIGVPGPVEASTGTVIRPPIMQGWDGYRIPEFFAELSAATVLVDNDVNMMAFGEYSHRRDTKHLLYVKVGTGIGCGIVSDGILHRGASGAAGDIGHIRLPGHEDVLCHCGNTGCVEAVASGAAIARALREEGLPAGGGRDVVRLVSEGNPIARRRVRMAGQQIGEVLASLVSFHNPDAIVLGGSIAQLHEDLLADIRGVIYRRALPLATRSLAIETSALGERAGVEGAARLAARHLLSPQGIERLLARPVR